MIARIWHGWTTPSNAHTYESLLRAEIFPAIEARRIAGMLGMQLLRRTVGAEVEFTTIMRFDDLEAIGRFAGEDLEACVVPPKARTLLSRFDQRARHDEICIAEQPAPPVYDHVGIRTADLDASTRFYADALACLGYVEGYRDADVVGFGRPDAPAFWIHRVGAGEQSRVHVAFRAADRDSIAVFHRTALAAGGRDNGAPGPRPHYGTSYFAAFVLDPDGNNVEAMCN